MRNKEKQDSRMSLSLGLEKLADGKREIKKTMEGV